ncbi:MAG: hypothetical protein IPJ78_07385 [Gemmatimonadetes bacterium]|nr:hypothetical protein [Gemmatimonadota bacterium]
MRAAPVSSTTERRAVQVVVLTAAWTVVYSLFAFLLPDGLPGRPMLMDTAFLPFHPLAARALWLTCRSMPDGTPRWRGFRALMWSQIVGVINSLAWIAASAGLPAANSALYQAVGPHHDPSPSTASRVWCRSAAPAPRRSPGSTSPCSCSPARPSGGTSSAGRS